MQYRNTSFFGSLVILAALSACSSGPTDTASTFGSGSASSGASGGNGGSGGESSGSSSGGNGTGGSSNVTCPAIPACNAPLPDPGTATGWNSIIPPFGDPKHLGRDMFYNPGDTQWIMAKFAFGTFD